jgi:D-sedoheptulose 7-phosphate isomerase
MNGGTATATVPATELKGGISTLSRHVAASNAATREFFSENAPRVALACDEMARRFSAGGKLLVAADRDRKSDISHAVVEFMHPVVVGKRALPAIALGCLDHDEALANLRAIGRAGDILLAMSSTRPDSISSLHDAALGCGILPIQLTGGHHAHRDHGSAFLFSVKADDACVVQEAHELLYHVLWELIHVFLDGRGR